MARTLSPVPDTSTATPQVTKTYRKLSTRIEALNLKALSTATNGTGNIEGIRLGQGCHTPVRVLGFVHHSISTGALQQQQKFSTHTHTHVGEQNSRALLIEMLQLRRCDEHVSVSGNTTNLMISRQSCLAYAAADCTDGRRSNCK